MKKGQKMPESGKLKLRNLYLGKTYKELYGEEKANQMKLKLSKLSKGIPKSLEHNLKNSLANKGKHKSEEAKKNMSLAQQKRKERDGCMVLPEARKKMSLIRLGKKLPPMKEETKRKMSETKKRLYAEGKLTSWAKGLTKESDERINKISNLLKNRKVAESTKIKISINKARAEKIRLSKLGYQNPAWLGGKSFEPYGAEFNTQFKNQIRKRDNQICMNCGKHREQLKDALNVHHVNYDKKLTIPENCISLCNSCHTLTNTNREYWTKLFQEKLAKSYDYKYENGKVILNIGGLKNE